MSVPDWPNSYGYNMFLFPPRLWVGGILYEHTHRLMGTVVGMLSIVLTIIAWRTERRRWVRWLATSVLGTVIFQGILGGLRVVPGKLDLAIVHACAAQPPLPPVTASQVWLHMGHRLGAIVVSIAVLILSIHVIRRHRDSSALLRPALLLLALLLLALLAAQLTLGVLTVLLRKPA